MGSSQVQVVGNVVAAPKVFSMEPGRERVSLRVVATERRLSPEGAWVDGDEFGVTVVCWRALARNAVRSLQPGTPVVVLGRLVHRQFEHEGQVKSVVEIKAQTVGVDLTRGTAEFRRIPAESVGTAEVPDEAPSESTLPNETPVAVEPVPF